MRNEIKSLLKSALPESVLHTLRLVLQLPRAFGIPGTRRALAAAADAPSYLDISALETLQMRYPHPPATEYDPHALEVRGRRRAAQLLRLPGAKRARSFLELACWDGMVSCCLRRKGKETTAIDNRSAGFQRAASREGVRLLQMDATGLGFKDQRFDFVFSYDAFEHFSSPEHVLREAIRVVREHGYIYLDFGPLYYSPYGEHAYRSITVPYCQFLFQRTLLNDFVNEKGLDPIPFDQMNGWSVEDYRDLWRKYSRALTVVRCHEDLDLSHLSLIRKHPSCFKSRSRRLDNFIVSRIGVLFQRRDSASPRAGMPPD